MDGLLDGITWNKKLEIIRIIKGWTQQEAAQKFNTTQKVYWNWETGNAYPRKNSRLAISKAFKVKESEIFINEGSETNVNS